MAERESRFGGSAKYEPGEILGECERILAAHEALPRCVSIEPRHTESQTADLRIRFGDRGWLSSPGGEGLIAAFEEHPAIAGVERKRADLLLRFTDEALLKLEERLGEGEAAGMGTADLLAGKPHHVSLVGPNANKALHLGHLRNVALGHALASGLTAAGAPVHTRSLVADMGRRTCEAMSGYLDAYEGQSPESLGVSGDRFVELCSRAFQGEAGRRRPSTGPNAQEEEVTGDKADELMAAWLRGDASEQELWRRMRGWVLEGHERTLARLGVRIDEYDFESEDIPRALDLVALGLELDLFEQEESGAVVYRSGRGEYETMVLLNAEGTPTECARVLAVCHRIVDELDPEVTFVEVLGDEWRPAQTVVGDVLARLLPSHADKHYEWIYYGLVTTDGQKMGSSNGEVVWIDDFLDRLAAGPAVAALEEIGGGAVSREELADLLARATFLCAPMAQLLPLDVEGLFEEQAGAAWTIAEAWARAAAAAAGRPQASGANRAGAMLSQQFRPALREALERRDPVILAGYLQRLSEAFLDAPAMGPAARPVLERVLAGLGFTAATRQPSNQPLIEA
ncbi:MAG TPA: arginine--tRNA ligase [Solirubrobacterales bacterium]|nr:arginine--tRNA ligase [Solirubrobacterales bacterium]